MGENTSIAWTNHTFNPWIGCTKVSPGCDNCYAEYWSEHRFHQDAWGKGKPRRLTSKSTWAKPLEWNREAEKEGVSHLVFSASLADVMDDEAPAGAQDLLWALIDQTPHLIWQLLTKRPHRYERYLPPAFKHNNVWLGTSAENQHFYNVRWPILRTACQKYNAISFISYEPALGPLSIAGFDSKPDWMICGGESGEGFRPMDPQWAKALRDECEQCGVDFFMKQMSAKTLPEAATLIPAELLIRQFPAQPKDSA